MTGIFTRVVSIILAVVFLFGIVMGAVWAVWQSSRPENQPVDLTKKSVDPEAETLPDFEPLTEPIAELRAEDRQVGSGRPAAPGDIVTVVYIGALASSGEVVEVGRGETFGLGPENASLLEGWVQGLPGIAQGGIRRLFLPAELAYGEIGQPESGIPPDTDMVYDFELIAIADGGLEADEMLADFEPTTEPVTGLVIDDRVDGDGDAVQPGDTVSVYYTGALVSNGVVFDASSRHGPDPATFSLNGVIAGWTEGLVGMKVGGQRRLLIPSDKAYGPAGTPDGSIPPNADLVFDIELVEINPGGPAGE